MASRHVRWVLANRDAYPDQIDRDIMVAIASHIGYDDQPARLSMATIAEYAGCHFNTVDKRTKALSESGALVVEKVGRYLTYSLPASADAETIRGDEPPPGATQDEERIGAIEERLDGLEAVIHDLRADVKELAAMFTSLPHDVHTTLTPRSHEVHTSFTSDQSGDVNKEVKKGRREEEGERAHPAPARANGHTGLLLEMNAPAPATAGERALLSHPATLLWVRTTERWPGYDALPGIVERLGDEPDAAALGKAWQTWILSGYKRDNALGVLDWYREMHADPEWEPSQRFRQPARASPKAAAEEIKTDEFGRF